jgi:transcriptional regulator with XRE-family HTH domain
MKQGKALVDSLKRVLRNRGLTYRDVAQALGISEASVKRTFSERSFSLARLEAVCELLDLRFIELCRLAERFESERDRHLSIAQEQALAADPVLLGVFYRLLSGWNARRIEQAQGLDAHRITRLLVNLDRLGLIELQPGNEVRLIVGPRLEWRRDGPLWRRYAEPVQEDFFRGRFDGTDDDLRFETGELSKASLELMQRKLERLAQEFHELVELDASLPAERRRHAGLMLAVKPWVYSALFGEP